ncbi:MAG: FAD-dependent oxidoreductase [Bacteroidota bacterium]|nr:FAD-dependent oxidoreductase [Bacteroidota bacterium]
MTIIKIKLKSKKEVASSTMEFRFDKPEGFTYKAGQFADYTLINPKETDAEGNVRGFSLASAPYEDHVMFSTRMRDTAFKRNMHKMDIGTEVNFDAPYGSFTLQNNMKIPAVFLSGGIGITPVRSIILQATHDKTEHKIFLFYANKTPTDAAYLDELTEAQKANANYKFIASMTDEEGSKDWKGERGFFTKEMLQKYIGDLSIPVYYISGPATMLSSIRKTLNESGINDDNIRTEEFTGYK